MLILCVIITMIMLSVNHAETDILIPPQSRNATISTGYVTMTCKARADGLYYTVNGLNGGLDYVVSLGFVQGAPIRVAPGVLERNLTIKVSEMTNNSRIVCVSYNSHTPDSIVKHSASNVAKLQVQGPLKNPDNLKVVTNNKSGCNLSWTAPQTFEGTIIDGYNISINGSHYVFTENTEASISFVGSNSPCTPLQVEVSAFNGIDGDSAELQLYPPSVPNKVLVMGTITVDVGDGVSVNLTVNVSNLCEGEKPQNIKTIVYNFSDIQHEEIFSQTHDLVPDDKEDQILFSKDSIRLNRSTDKYHIIYELSNCLGPFNRTGSLYICSEEDPTKVSINPCSSGTSNGTGTVHFLQVNPVIVVLMWLLPYIISWYQFL